MMPERMVRLTKASFATGRPNILKHQNKSFEMKDVISSSRINYCLIEKFANNKKIIFQFVLRPLVDRCKYSIFLLFFL